MVSTYTSNNGIEKPGSGDQADVWDVTANNNYDLLDTAIDGQVTVTLTAAGSSGSPSTLAITDGTASDGRNKVIKFVDAADLGATAYVQITPNDAQKVYFISNGLSGSRDIVLFQGTYSSGNALTIPNGKDVVVKTDGAGTGAKVELVLPNPDFTSVSATTMTTGTITATTPIAVTSGGTGVTSYSALTAAQGLVIGTDTQAYDATLTSIASLGTAADRLAYTTGVDTWAETPITTVGRAFLDDTTTTEQRTTLGLNVQTSGLSADRTITSADNRVHFYISASITLTLPNPSTVGADFEFDATITGGSTTVSTLGGTIYGMSGAALYVGNHARFVSDGTDWWVTTSERATTSKEGFVLKASSADLTSGVADTYPDSATIRADIDAATDLEVVFLRAKIDSAGTIIWSRGLTSVSKSTTGIYQLHFPARATAEYVVNLTHEGTGFVSLTVVSLTTTSCVVYVRTTSGLADLPFFVSIVGAQ